MKIALIFQKSQQSTIFNQKALDRLAKLGEVVCHDSDDLSDEAIKATIKDADVAITSWASARLNKEVLDAAPNLKLHMHAAGTVKPYVCDEMWERGVRCCASTEPLGIGVAECALGFAISASKNFYQCNADIHNGDYGDHKANCRELYEINVGVVSAGFVGRHFIKLMQNFGVNVLVYDPMITDERAAELGATKVDFETLLKESDILSIHAPSIPETYHLFNADTLPLMKKDAVLINTSRGSLIDEQALYEHMAKGNLKYACLDVYDPEPLYISNPLRTLKNCILTPHLAGLCSNGKLRIGAHAADEIERFVKGEKLHCEVTQAMLATIA